MAARLVKLIYHRHNFFPEELIGEEEWNREIRRGDLRRATLVIPTYSDGSEGKQVVADTLPDLRKVFDEVDPLVRPAPPRPPKTKTPRAPRPAPPPVAPPAPAPAAGDLWQALQDYIALVARRDSKPSEYAALIGRFGRASAVRLDGAGQIALEPFKPGDANQVLVALGDGEILAVVPTYEYVSSFDILFSEPVMNPPVVRLLFELDADESRDLRLGEMAVIRVADGAVRVTRRGRLGGFGVRPAAAPLSTRKAPPAAGPPAPPTPSPPPPADDEAAPPPANPLLPWLVIGGLLILLLILLFAQNRRPPSMISSVQPTTPTYSSADPPETNAPAPASETAPPPTYPTSFDCAAATLPSERTICETEDIAAQDVEMARLHGALLSGLPPPDRGRTVDEQTAWRRGRDECGGQPDPAACLRQAYAARIDRLRTEGAALQERRAAEMQDTPPATAPASTPPAMGRTTPPQPLGHFPSWITTADYPDWARRSGESGVTGYSLLVDAAGRLAGCDIISSSGSRALDELACQLFRQRGRFSPARDAAGNPIAGRVGGNVTWAPPPGGK